eukprot:6063471-Amphidinium_carterae.3
MRSIETLAVQIRNKEFKPDATRSGRWWPSDSVESSSLSTPCGTTKGVTAQCQQPPAEAVVEDEALSSLSDSASATTSAMGEDVDDKVTPDAQVGVHVRSGVTHLVQSDDLTF